MDFNTSLSESLPLLHSSSFRSSGVVDTNSVVSSTDCEDESTTYIVYRRRWWMLSVICAVAFAQGLLWNTWSPIGDVMYIGYDWSDSFLAFILAMCSGGLVVLAFPIMYFIETRGEGIK